jgi:hypothetical protein
VNTQVVVVTREAFHQEFDATTLTEIVLDLGATLHQRTDRGCGLFFDRIVGRCQETEEWWETIGLANSKLVVSWNMETNMPFSTEGNLCVVVVVGDYVSV